MEGFGLGLFDLIIGVTIALFGLRFFFLVLPVGAFFIGGYAGSMAVHHLFDEGFLNTFASIVAGFAVGIGLALVAFLAWYVGALILAAAVGAMLGSGLVAAFTSDADVLTFVVALAGAALLVFVAYRFNLPAWVIVISTSLVGAAIAVLGALLIFNRVETEELQDGPALALVNYSWFWVLVWAVVAGAGIVVQYKMSKEIELPESRWSRLQPETYARLGRTA
jgi:Domain of unknown function (DUF4203)